MLLIFNYWQTGKPLPTNRLASISKLNERWTDVEQTLAEFFELDENDHWYHERIEMDLNKVKSKSIQASKAGKLSAAKRAASKAIVSKDNSNGRSFPVERKSNHTEADTDTEAEANTEADKKEKIKPVPAKKKQEIVVIEYPSELNKEAWMMWIENRRLSKTKKFTPKGEQLAIRDLIAMGDHKMQRMIIEKSMSQGYQGLFPLKADKGKSDENSEFRKSLQDQEWGGNIL